MLLASMIILRPKSKAKSWRASGSDSTIRANSSLNRSLRILLSTSFNFWNVNVGDSSSLSVG
eukprot:7363484-Ditylum_brightwellii.AAC.1